MARRHASSGPKSAGQVLVMFVLFLLVLLGISALAIDYASWLLTDRALQNVSDHAALAGASQFDDRTIASANCEGGLGQPHCNDARKQAWASLSHELGLNLSSTIISCLATVDSGDPDVAVGDSPTTGETDTSRASSGACTSEAVVDFGGHTVWVTTPPPNDGSYLDFGGRYSQNYGIVWVRVDRPVQSFLGGALGITPNDRTGWATAGALPADFALQTFCRDQIAPESGVCVNSAGVTIDGQGGIRLLRGDIGSNESLKVSSGTGQGVILETGNMFLVNQVCSNGTWGCPGNPQDPYGGIVNQDPSLAGAVMKNAFYMAPLPVPQFESPVDNDTDHSYDCSAPDVATNLCVPYRDQTNSTPSSPGNWTCSTTSSTPIRCGAPTITTDVVTGNSTVECVGQGGGNPGNHYYPNGVTAGASSIQGDAGNPRSNGNEYLNIDDDAETPDPDTTSTPANPPTDWVYTDNISTTGSASSTFTVSLGASGPRMSGLSTVRYTVFKTNAGAIPTLDDGNVVTVTVRLFSGSTTIFTDVPRTLTNVPTQYFFETGAITSGQFNSLRLQYTFNTTTTTGVAADRRGGGVAATEIQHPDPQPAVSPTIPPGYYESIIIPDGGCAVMDPTGEYSGGMRAYQMPGIYQFGGTGGTNDWKIQLGTDAFLIGDGVTLVFDFDWPDSGSSKGVATSADSGLVLNTMRVPGVAPCTPTETETLTLNESAASLGLLQYSAVCAAWGVDTSVTSGVRPGASAWNVCTSDCALDRTTDYDPVANYRGITFYFTPDPGWGTAHASMNPRNRFEMQGTDSGMAFRGVMYAPYDDVRISGGNGFSTVGQVLAWTVKFNGGSAFIDLDYPYAPTQAPPYLLEPTIQR